MKGFTLFLGMVLYATHLGAQTQKLGLDAALAQALANRVELRTRQIELQIAENADATLKAQWRPQISAAVDLRYNTQLQKSVIPIGEFGIPGTPSDAKQTVAFGVPFQGLAGLDVKQKVFDPTYRVDKKINAAEAGLQQTLLEQEQTTVRLQVIAAYYNALLQQENVALAESNLARLQFKLETTKVRLQNGALLKNDVDKMALDVSNAVLLLRQRTQDYELALRQLVYRIQLPPETTIELADNLAGIMESIRTKTVENRIGQRPEIRAEQINREINGLKADKMRAQLRPEVSAYGNFSLLGLDDYFSTFNYLGLRVNIPIYDGRQARLASDEFQLRQQINDTRVAKLQADFAFTAENARIAVVQAYESLEESRKNVALARQILVTDQTRFEQGAMLRAELKDSEYSVQNAEDAYLKAVYDFLSADLEYRMAMGNW